MPAFVMDDVLVLGAALLLVAAAVWDVRCYRIPNALCAGLAALFLGHAAAAGPPFPFLSLVIAVLVFGAGSVMFARGLLGGGDVKLLAAAVVWIPSASVPAQIGAVFIAGGVLALMLLAVRGILRRVSANTDTLPRVLHDQAPVPYGVAIAAGTLLYLPLI